MNGVINHLWQSTLFAIAAAGIAYLLRDHSARTRYWIWTGASLKFLLPCAMLASWGASVELPPGIRPVSARNVERIETVLEPAFALAPPEDDSPWPAVLGALWMLGTAAVIARRTRQLLALRRTAKHAKRTGCIDGVPVLEVQGRLEPGVFGILRPVLLLPRDLRNHLDDAQFRTILDHELCHVRYRDNLTAALHMAVEALFWFYPLVWWIGARLLSERERACDETVLTQGGRAEDYASGVVNVCRHYLESRLPCAAGVTGGDLAQRVRTIMTWVQPAPLSRMQQAMLIAVTAGSLFTPYGAGVLRAQADHDATFEVASVRPSSPDAQGVRVMNNAGSFRMENVSLTYLIHYAYSIQPSQLSAPAWARSERFDITAKLLGAGANQAGPARDRRARSAMRALLGERFQLKLREDVKDLPVYSLTVDRAGHKMQRADSPAGRIRTSNNAGTRSIVAEGLTMRDLALMLNVNRPVLDRTGLEAAPFDFKLEWSDSADTASEQPGIFTAIREQLGLRLEPARGPVTSYVIDRAERPSEN